MAKQMIFEKEFMHAGLHCSVVLTRLGHRCGYVAVDESHPLFGKSDEDEEVCKLPAHGGITYAGEFPTEQYVLKGLWAFGFDCVHLGDAPDIESVMRRFNDLTTPEMISMSMRSIDGAVWTQAYVENECRQLAEALAPMGAGPHRKKIALNNCFGGFRLSPKACNILSGMGVFAELGYCDDDDIKFRTNPKVIEVIERLGEEASDDSCAKIVIEEYDDENFLPRINEYDGAECLELIPLISLDKLMSLDREGIKTYFNEIGVEYK